MAAMVLVGVLMGRQVDARWLVGAGLLVMAAASYWMANMNLHISPTQVVLPRMLLMAGVGLIFAPISVAAYKYTPLHLRGAAVGLASLLRTEGGSVGTSLASTVETRREQLHTARIGDGLSVFNNYVVTYRSRPGSTSSTLPATWTGRGEWASSR